jgi:ribosomal 30S subunit maturation factor RimM
VYVVRGDDGEHMIPAVPEFVKEIDMAGGVIKVKLIEGM